jgi:hypothetical protein
LATAGFVGSRNWHLPDTSRAARFLRKLAAPAKPVLANLVSIPLTVLGYACVDIGVFKASTVAGWIVTGVTLMVLEHQIADEK